MPGQVLTSCLTLTWLLPLCTPVPGGGEESCFVFPGSVERTSGRVRSGQAQPGFCSPWFSRSDCKTSGCVAVGLTLFWGLATFALVGWRDEAPFWPAFPSSALELKKLLSDPRWASHVCTACRTQSDLWACQTAPAHVRAHFPQRLSPVEGMAV